MLENKKEKHNNTNRTHNKHIHTHTVITIIIIMVHISESRRIMINNKRNYHSNKRNGFGACGSLSIVPTGITKMKRDNNGLTSPVTPLSQQQQQQFLNPFSSQSANHTQPAITRHFLQSAQTHLHLQKDDLVLIVVPEEFEILAEIDPSLHGRMAYVTKIESEEVQVTLRPLKRKRNDRDVYSSLKLNNSQQQQPTVWLPKFCLCLEDEVLRKRVQEAKNKAEISCSSSSAAEKENKNHHEDTQFDMDMMLMSQ